MRVPMDRIRKAVFVGKCLLAAEILMFGSMAAGEVFIDLNLFGGFLTKPEIWYGIFFETAIAVLPVSLSGTWVLSKVRFQTKRIFLIASLSTWLLLCLMVVVFYQIFYFSNEWKVALLHPAMLFGWIIPGILIIGCFVWLSETLFVVENPFSRNQVELY